MRRSLLAVWLVMISVRAGAVYDSNIQGVLTGVWNYDDRDSIYFHLDNQPASHPVCNPNYFVIPSSVPADRRHMIFSRLLMAYASGETINIGYDGTGDCAEGSIHAIRVG